MDRPQVLSKFTYIGGQVCCSFDNAFLDGLEVEYAVPHRAWRGNGWVDKKTGLDIPPPHHKDMWWCYYTIKTDDQGDKFAILVPVELVLHGPPHYVPPSQQAHIDYVYYSQRRMTDG